MLPKRTKRLNATELARLVERYESGGTVYELALEFMIDRRTVSQRLREQGLLRRQSPSSTMIDDMARLYQSGLSLLKVGRQLDVNAETVRRALPKAGVRPRPRRGWTY